MITKFLVADDDEDDIELFEKALQMIDPLIEFHYAADGRSLIGKLQTLKILPQIIFIDVNMPVMNGWECLHALKAEESFRNIPVIMYSTSSSVLYGKRAVNSGALGFYEKPTNFLYLKEFLQTVYDSSAATLKRTLQEMPSPEIHLFYTE